MRRRGSYFIIVPTGPGVPPHHGPFNNRRDAEKSLHSHILARMDDLDDPRAQRAPGRIIGPYKRENDARIALKGLL